MVGNTPLLELTCSYRGKEVRVFAKYEQRNMTGSVKDRMALWILRGAYESGALKAGDTIAEATSGNTGVSFAAIGRSLGHPVRVYMPDWMSRERVMLTEAFGAEIIPVSKDQGGFLASIAMANEYAGAVEDVFLPRQFDNLANPQAHEATTGPEIVEQLASLGLVPDAFIAGVGTGGTIMGVGSYLKLVNPRVSLHPLEPANSPTLRTGHKVGHHRIQGISDEFIPSILKLSELDEIVDVWDGDAIRMTQELARRGLAVGISSGANFLGAIEVAARLGSSAVVATVFADSNKKYLSTDLFHEEPAREDYRSPQITSLRWRAIGSGSV
jgi:cysteine synthase